MKFFKTIAGIGFFTLLVVIGGCSSSKEARKMKYGISGEWILQTVQVEGISGKFKATVFNEADFNCFIGSTWTFVANNSIGEYRLPLTGNACPAVTRSIRWSINEPNANERKFQFKRLDEKRNPIDNNDGFRLDVVTLTDNNMQLKSSISFEGNPAAMIYNFTKK